MKRTCLLLCSLLLLGPNVFAQTSREELLTHPELTAGNYTNYPAPTGHLTPAPKGYEPFYISHYGRHGARYMTGDKQYRRLNALLDSAHRTGLLTPYGENVRERVIVAAADAKGRAGSLTRLGARQHRAIARRMFDNYPELMGRPLRVTANSSDSRRVIHSMEAFCGELAELNPTFDISMAATAEDQFYVKANKSIEVPESETDGPLYRKLKTFRHRMLNGEPQMKALFTDPEQARGFVDPYTLADDLYNVASDMQCLPELGLSFADLFGEDGLVDGFRAYNAAWCLWEGLMPGAKKNYLRIYPLLQNFLDNADEMIASGGCGLRLRFGHDDVVLPFSFVLGFPESTGATDDLENLHRHFSIFRLIPMGANIQWIFYRKPGSRDILVKFLMNENETSVPLKTDCYPYYHWKDVRAYYRKMIADANLTWQTR